MRVYPCLKPAVRRLLNRILPLTAGAAAFFVVACAPARAQETAPVKKLPQTISTRAYLAEAAPKVPKILRGHVVIPASNLPSKQGETGRMYTNFRFFAPDANSPEAYPPYTGYLFETPESIACVYGLVTAVAGCNPNTAVNVPAGGSKTIAIVDAYDDPSAAGDLAWFSDQMGLPLKTSQFHVVYAAGYQPSVDYTGGWELEEALDVEWAHAMAPNATIYLVEAASNYDSDLFTAVQVATNLVQCGQTTTCSSVTGSGEVSMSWGGSEGSTETTYDTYLQGKNVVYIAASGDSAGVIYPAASPYVMSVGGTALSRSLVTGNLQLEVSWQDTGGGPSAYEARPSYQPSTLGAKRVTPDVAADADPNTGLWVYNSFPYDGYYYSSNWWLVGGTSASTQLWAGILNAASTANADFAASTSAELTKFYADMAGTGTATYANSFKDILAGSCGPYDTYFAAAGFDDCTGVGVPHTYAGK
ncbi:MAG TPA: S53 family peptidase [Terracidiphilus sp.]|nr:S53 family peptidase [Terracidiphilus sp.]